MTQPSLRQFGLLLFGFLCPCVLVKAQDQPDLTLSEVTKSETISQIIELLKSKYVFPQVAAQMGNAILDHAAKHDYDPITSARTFADKLQSDLRAVSNDQHLAVDYSYQPVPQQSSDGQEQIDQEHADRIRYRGRLVNYWFKNADILPGNIGYLKFDGFFHLEFGGRETVEAAMTFLGGTNALIIDLRENTGGAPDAGSLIMGYLFDRPTHLSDFVSRPENSRTPTWISPHDAGKKYEGDVYILTGKETISAAEGFAYDLQSVKRAIIVGEPTAGAAHPAFEYRVGKHFTLELPTSRVINLTTNTDWEGTGVKPDVVTDQALNRAQLLALRKLVKDQPDYPFIDERKKAIKQLEVELSGQP